MSIDLIVSISLAILALSAFAALIILSPVVWQLFKALTSVNYLLDVVKEDLEPVIRDIGKSVSEAKQKFDSYSNSCKTQFSNLGSNVFSGLHGFVSGIKEYVGSLKN